MLRYAFPILAMLTLAFTPPMEAQPASVADQILGITDDVHTKIQELIRTRKWKAAEKMLNPLLKGYPESEQALLYQIGIVDGVRNYKSIPGLVKNFLKLHPESKVKDQALYFLGKSYGGTGYFPKAIETMKEVIAISEDEVIKKNSQLFIDLWENRMKIGIYFGGALPKTPEEKKTIADIQLKILERALDDYKSVNGAYPESLDALLKGNSPYLRSLPENPQMARQSYFYARQGDKYLISAEPILSATE